MEDDTSLGGSPASARSHDSIDSAPELPAPLRQLDSAACRQLQQQYPQLTEINFSGHALTSGAITPLLSVYLPSLRTINFSLNHLTSVPDMGALTQLTSLDLSGNEISHLSHLSVHRSLTSLNLAQNQFADLTSICSEMIMECPSLTSLSLSHNPLTPSSYRAAILTLLPDLATLDGAPVPAEEQAYLQLLAAGMPNTARESDSPARHTERMTEATQTTYRPSHAYLAPGDSRVIEVDDDGSAPDGSHSESLSTHTSPNGTVVSDPPSQFESRSPRLVDSRHAASGWSLPTSNERHQIPAIELHSPSFIQPSRVNYSQAPLPQLTERSYAAEPQIDQPPTEDSEPEDGPSSTLPPLNAPPRTPSIASSDTDEFISATPLPLSPKNASPTHREPAPLPPRSADEHRTVKAVIHHTPAPTTEAALTPPQTAQPQERIVQASVAHQPAASYPHPYAWSAPSYAPFFPPPPPHMPAYHTQAGYFPLAVPVAMHTAHQPATTADPVPPAAPAAVPPPSQAAPPLSASAPSASSSSVPPSALSDSTQLVHSLQQQLDEAKQNLAREQAHVRTVKAYYQARPHASDEGPTDIAISAPAPAPAPQAIAAALPRASPPSQQAAAATPPISLPLLSNFAPPPPSPAPSILTSGMTDSYRAEIAHLKKQNELLQVQNETAAEIMRMKDRQTAEERARRQSPGGIAAGDSAEPDLAILWREKVFALLVQNKSLLLTHAGDIHAYKQQLSSKSESLAAAEQQVQILTKTNAALEAQLQMMRHEATHRSAVQSHAHQLQSQAHATQQQVQKDLHNIHYLLGVFRDSLNTIETKTQQRVEGRLRAFNARLTYAADRVQVMRAMKQRRQVMLPGTESGETSRRRTPAADTAESKQSSEGEGEADTDSDASHLLKEIKRLQSDRSLIYSSWQNEVSSLRSQLRTESTRAESAAASSRALQDEVQRLEAELDRRDQQHADLTHALAEKVDKSVVDELHRDHESRSAELHAELATVRDELLSLQQKYDATHKSSLKLQVELQHTKHALSQAKTDAAELHASKYDYLEEKLKRREVQYEEVQAEKRKMQQQIRDMDHQIILLRHGVGQTIPQAYTAGPLVAPIVAQSATARPPNPFSSLLFGGGGGATSAPVVPIPHTVSTASVPPPVHAFMRPQPIQSTAWSPKPPLQYQPPSSQHRSGPTTTTAAAPAPTMGSAAAATEAIRSSSIAPSPMRTHSAQPHYTPAPIASASTAGPPNPHNIPLLQFPPSATPSGASSPSRASHQPTSVARKLSHLAALSARLLDEEDTTD